MVKSMLACIGAVSVLGGCASTTSVDARAGDDSPPAQCEVKVFVRNGYVVVNNEPVHPKGCANSNTVTWVVKTPNYGFDPANGLNFAKGGSSPVVTCQKSAAQYACSFTVGTTGTYPYAIRLIGPNGVAATVDPSVILD